MTEGARGDRDDLPRRSGRTHPPSLLKLAERTIRDEHLIGRGDTILCACSGGPDSTALLHVLALLRRRVGHSVVALGVDHGLRPEAPAELALAADLAASLDVPFRSVRVDVPRGSNLQARARAARLASLLEGAEAAGARAVATGHTADDRAETFLLRLLRGAGPRGLAVLPARAPFPPRSALLGVRGITEADDAADPPQGLDNAEGASQPKSSIALIRPLIRARRVDVMTHLQRHRLVYAEDPSNLDPRFTRVRVRRELLPLLEDLSPKIVEHLGALAAMLSQEDRGIEGSSGLGRAQRQAIERALRLGRSSVRVLVNDDRELCATFPDGQIVLTKTGRTRRAQR